MWAKDNCDSFLPLAESERLALEDWLALHGPDPGDALTDVAASGFRCATMDDEVPAQSAYTELAAAMQTLMPPAPLVSGAVHDDLPAAPDSAVSENLLLQVVSQACLLTDADGAALVLRSEEGIVCQASTGSAPAVGSRLRPGSGLSEECFRLGQVVRCDDAENDSRVNAAVARRLQSRSILIAPIRVEGSTCGVLQVLSSRPFAFHAGHTVTLVHLAELVGSSLEAEERAREVAPAVKREVAEPPSQQLVSGAFPGKAAEIAHAAPDLPIAIAQAEPGSRSNLPRYTEFIGILGLLAAASLLWMVVSVQQRTRAAQKVGDPQQAQAAVTPAQPSPESQPKAIGSERESVESLPTRPLPAPHHEDVGTHSPRVALKPQLVDAPRLAIPIPSTSAAKSDSEMTAAEVEDGKPAAIAAVGSGRKSGESLHTRPLPAPHHEDADTHLPRVAPKPEDGRPAAIAAVVGVPPTVPVIIAPPRLARVSEGVVRGGVISQPKPVYPQAALSARVKGSVVLAATIGTDGRIKKLQVVNGDPRLAGAALDAVRKWRYQPSYLDGTPVEIDINITVNFTPP